MRKIKVNVECWWTDSRSIGERIKNQFFFDKDYEMFELTCDDPDFTIVLGKTDFSKIKTPPRKTFYFSQEPLWSPNEERSEIHLYCDTAFVNDKNAYPEHTSYVETLVPMLYGGSGENHHDREYSWNFKDISTARFVKSKNISTVCTKDHRPSYDYLDTSSLYKINNRYRTDFCIEVSNNNKVDVFGNHWEPNGINVFGGVWNKHVALNEYRFSIGLENTIQKNYISEKFWDVVLCETVPIYLGCSNISDYLDTSMFLYLNELDHKTRIEAVNEIAENGEYMYDRYKEGIRELKNKFLFSNSFNLWNKFKQHIH